VPPDSESWLPTDEVVRLYRKGMQIEQCFRDWKSHLGLRGLHLQVQKSKRLLQRLMAFTLAYLLWSSCSARILSLKSCARSSKRPDATHGMGPRKC
jgi:hypothetical protein